MGKFLNNIDLGRNELQNARIHNLPDAPAQTAEGLIYYDSQDKRGYIHNGSVFIPFGGDVENARLAEMAANTIKGRSGTLGRPQDLTPAQARTILNVEDGAQVNTVTSVNTKTGAVTVTKSDVGLANVTNDAQVKKSASSVNGNVPAWSGTNGDALSGGYGVETTLIGAASAIPRADAVKNYVDGLLGASDAMVYKGVIDASANPNYPAADAGHTYKVSVAGKIGGASGPNVEQGDLIICILDGTVAGDHATVGARWTIIQTNIDGAVIGPVSAVNNNFPAFDGANGRVIKDSGVSPASFAAAGHDHEGTYIKKHSASVGNGTNLSYTVEHNLGTRDITVSIREVDSPYGLVFTQTELTTENMITLVFAEAPTTNQYRVTITG